MRVARIVVPKPLRVVNRAPWQPNNAKSVVLACGHVTLNDLLIKRLRPLLEDNGAAFCDSCDDWIPVYRDATPAEVAGIDLSSLYTGDEPPF
jgi:hypothetical protein